MSKQNVRITLTSRQEDEGQSEVTRQVHEGTLYAKEGADYLLYAEEGVNTSIRLDPHEVRLYRRGEVSSWQNFQLGEMTGGQLELGVSSMVLRIMTSHLRIVIGQAVGSLDLHYEMWTGSSGAPDADPYEVSLGKFKLQLAWEALGEPVED